MMATTALNLNTDGSSSESENEVKIGNTFSMFMNKKLGGGAFGDIYKGINNKTGEEVAVKLESNKTRTPLLNYESKILKLLQGGVGIPNVYHITNIGECTIMVMDILDKNLDELVNENKKFSLKTILMIADQILTRVEYIHSKNIIHRDIKPENFLIGMKKKSHLIYLIDFGLAKRFKDPKTGEHIPYIEGKSMTGTSRYVSIYTHLGIEQSRRDDLESVGYVLVYLLKGEVPWQGIKSKTRKEKYKKIMDTKIATTPDILCSDIPDEFNFYFKYVRELQFEEKPDYQYMKDLFKKLMARNEYFYDYNFDWCIPKKEEEQINLVGLFSKLNINSDKKNYDTHVNTKQVTSKTGGFKVNSDKNENKKQITSKTAGFKNSSDKNGNN